ncbi:MAG TPA: hypothetical protein VFV79_05620, partial [Saprospiraceae bacterium]|nr:hypothetical protein [Saprospiraceae bacterium]
SGSPDLNACLGNCVTAEPKRAVSDGYFILLKGLKKGDHSIEFNTVTPGSRIPASVTYKVSVTR